MKFKSLPIEVEQAQLQDTMLALLIKLRLLRKAPIFIVQLGLVIDQRQLNITAQIKKDSTLQVF